MEYDITLEENNTEMDVDLGEVQMITGGGGGSSIDGNIPDYVKTEAERVAINVLCKQSNNTFSILAMADTHYKSDNEQIKTSIVHAGQGADIIRSIAHIDLAINLGDVCWGHNTSTLAEHITDVAGANKATDTAFRDIPNLRVKGNHDNLLDVTDENGEYINKTYPFISAYNVGAVFDGENAKRGYCYRDFDNFKLRVIAINTCDVEGEAEAIQESQSFIGSAQMNWLANALVLDDKEDMNEWSILLISHHPLDYPTDYVRVADRLLLAYKEGTSARVNWQNRIVEYDFTNGKNGATIIGNIHGHTHSNKVATLTESGYVRMAIPNACFSRSNSASQNGETLKAMYGDETTFEKVANTERDTAFCVLTIDKSKGMLYASGYGATEDREVDYMPISYTNQIPISTDADGNIYDGDGWKADTRLNSSGVDTSGAGYGVTGFIPIPAVTSHDEGQVALYLKNIEALPTDASVRVGIYDASKTKLGVFSAQQNGSVNATENGYTLYQFNYWVGDDGYISRYDLSTLIMNQLQGAAYVRVCATGLDGDSIITVSEPIE